jgi:GGDEF domain-containing protein
VAPGGVLLLAVAALAHSGWLALSLSAWTLLYYCALAGGVLLTWRFHSSRIFFALLVLFLARQATMLAGAGHAALGTPGWTVLQAVSVLVPLNFIAIALMHERGFVVSSATPIGLFLFVQSVVVTALCRAAETTPVALYRAHSSADLISLPGYALFALTTAGIVLLVRSIVTRHPTDGALFWSLAAFALSLHFAGSQRISAAYWTAATCALAVSIVENSYLLAYHDELTALPSRRAFDVALLRLKEPFSIAIADIDHFKRFNDTYGHDTGDQVLRLVAARLARVTGGGQAYRCGGEEFAILFPGKTAPEVIDHLEELRARVEATEFRLRGSDRRQAPRGPDRRNQRIRRRPYSEHAIRQLALQNHEAPLAVTISIGVAASTSEKTAPDLVLQAADRALYRAKAEGRNRVETISHRRKGRIKAAGIA